MLAPHIQELVLLPSPVLRLMNLIDDGHLNNDEEYEGRAVGKLKKKRPKKKTNKNNLADL